MSVDLNYALLTRDVPPAYQLSADDVLKIEIADLVPRLQRLPSLDGVERRESPPFSYISEVQVSQRGEVLLPLVGLVSVDGLTMSEAQQRVQDAYAKGYLDKARVAVSLVKPCTKRVLVIGAVVRPNVYEMPKYESDVAHAIAMAGGIVEKGAMEIQVHRRHVMTNGPPALWAEAGSACQPVLDPSLEVLRIPLRSINPVLVAPEQVELNNGDVVVVRSQPVEVFFVAGRLATNNMVRFNVGRENRDLGSGFVLPTDRDVDVITAVAMAGYIDPIDSPTTVTVHRVRPDGTPMLIRVDLIAARYRREENIMVQPGDIIYLNPDHSWWFRRTFDRVIPALIEVPYAEAMMLWINPDRIR